MELYALELLSQLFSGQIQFVVLVLEAGRFERTLALGLEHVELAQANAELLRIELPKLGQAIAELANAEQLMAGQAHVDEQLEVARGMARDQRSLLQTVQTAQKPKIRYKKQIKTLFFALKHV